MPALTTSLPQVQECRASLVEVAALIRRAREGRGLTQHQLALRMGSTQSTVARWEGGEHEVTMKTLTRVAAALELEFVVRFGSQELATS